MRRTLLVLALLSTLPILVYMVGTVFTRHTRDDYCAAVMGNLYGLFGATGYWYDNWSGRLGAIFMHAAMTIIPSPLGSLVTVALLILWWAATYMLMRQFLMNTPYPREQSLLAATLFVGLTLNSTPKPATTLYWYSSVSVYLIGMTLMITLLWYVLSAGRGRWRTVVCFILALAAASCYDVGGMLLLVLLPIGFIVSWRISPRWDERKQRILAAWIGAGLSFIFILTAPGNASRALVFASEIRYPPLQLILSSPGAPLITAIFTAFYAPLLVIGLFGAYGYTVEALLNNKQRNMVVMAALGAVICTCLLVMMAFAPFAIFTGSGLTEYMMVPVFIFFYGGVGTVSYLFGRALRKRHTSIQPILKIASVGAVFLCIGLMTGQALLAVQLQRNYAQAWDRRDTEIHAAIRRGEGAPLQLPVSNPFILSLPTQRPQNALVVTDISGVNTISNNNAPPEAICGAWYYGVESFWFE
jgi:hypothetical protein